MKVEIIPYNPEWKSKYRSESAKIMRACGEFILTIEHAGSTSVEGLAAKPIVDIYVGTKSPADADLLIAPLVELGYEYVKAFEKEMPFRRYFRKDIAGKRAFHIHAVPAAHPFRRDDLMFRDYISVNQKAKKEYEALKYELAEKEWTESDSYTNAKTALCLKIKEEAFSFFSEQYEKTESLATYLMHSYSSEEARRKAGFKLLRQGDLTAIKTDIFPGFSLNRALGIKKINENFLNLAEEFFKGKQGKFALQIHPSLLNDEKTELLKSSGYSYANSWVTFFRDSSPVETGGTDLQVKEIGSEYAEDFGRILDEIFSFPHEFDEIASSSLGKKEWVTYMAFDGEKIAGSAAVCIAGDNAYLAFANVFPEYRRRGIQGELLSRRIDAARDRGVKWIFVDTAETSEEHPNPSYWNMLRHGFRLLYNRPNYVREQ
jgi:GrpB-like predicted nucleotidyltransferase (UPF0157 family)/GNAT superfamily N-acetyltransferase